MPHLASCCTKKREIIESSSWSETVCIFCIIETQQADVSILLQPFCITFVAVFSLFFLTISILPDKSKTCSLRKQATGGRDVILAPSLRDVRAALAVSCEQGRVRNIPLSFLF